MNSTSRTAALFVGLLIGAGALVFLLRGCRDERELPVGQATSDKERIGPNASSVPKSGGSGPATTLAQVAETFATLNHNPIEFYGRVVDQFDQPVPAADVRGVVLVNTGATTGEREIRTTTDLNGSFSFAGFKGQDLGISISKRDYEYRRENSSFSYSYFEADHPRHIPNANNPVIFRLWKRQGAEPLVHYVRNWRFPVAQEGVRINLLTGKPDTENPDLIVQVSRTPLTMPFGTGGFAWNASVELVGGGLFSAKDQDYYNLAPADGYQSHFEHRQESQDVAAAQAGRIKWLWREDVTEVFYIRGRDGSYFGRINLRIRPNVDRKEGDNQALVAAEVWINPNGSRNLEYDPAKTISVQP